MPYTLHLPSASDDATAPRIVPQRGPRRAIRGVGILLTLAVAVASLASFTGRGPIEAAPSAASAWAVNAGGGAVGTYAADAGFTGGKTASTGAAVTSAAVSSPAPAGVYQSERYGNFTYQVSGLSPSAAYSLRLDFAEIYWSRAGQRVFNVAVNGQSLLHGFDIVAVTGGKNRAVQRTSTVHADAQGAVTVTFSSVKDYAKVSGLRLTGVSAPPTTGALWWATNAGGGDAGAYHADLSFTGGNTASTTAAIRTTGVSNPAPQAVYQSERYGNFSYAFYDLAPGATYILRLDFAEIYWTAAHHRVFNVDANGAPMLRNFDIIAAAGARNVAIAKQAPVRADAKGVVTVRFSSLVDFAKVSGLALYTSGGSSTPGPTATPTARPTAVTTPTPRPTATPTPVPTPTPSPGSRGVPFSPTGPWNYRLPASTPLDPSSAAIMADIVRQKQQYYGTVGINTDSYTTGIYIVPANQPTVNMSFDDCQGKGFLEPQFADSLRNVPIPDTATATPGTDSSITIYQPSTDKEWEFWVAHHNGTNRWSACWGGRIDGVSTNPGIFPNGLGSTASGLPQLGFVMRISELQQGHIDHAINITMPEESRAVSWPAQRTDGYNPNGGVHLAQGQRFRLDPGFDVNSLPNAAERTIARAMQTYGVVCTDTAGAVVLAAEDPAQYERAHGGANPYPAIFGGTPSYNVLQDIPWNRMQVLPMNYGQSFMR